MIQTKSTTLVNIQGTVFCEPPNPWPAVSAPPPAGCGQPGTMPPIAPRSSVPLCVLRARPGQGPRLGPGRRAGAPHRTHTGRSLPASALSLYASTFARTQHNKTRLTLYEHDITHEVRATQVAWRMRCLMSSACARRDWSQRVATSQAVP